MLRYAFFTDFKGGPKLLLWGDSAGILSLSSFLQRMAAAPCETRFSDLGFSAAAGEDVIVVPQTDSVGGVRTVRGSESTFHWELDAVHAARFAEMVEVLSAPSCRGHQYLEHFGSADEITVMVSCGEYPDDLISRTASH